MPLPGWRPTDAQRYHAGIKWRPSYLLGKRSLTPVIAGHAITDVIIEPWLLLAAFSKAL